MDKHKAVIISGYIKNISDNIIPFLDKNTDIYIHTWNIESRWIKKVERYRKYSNKLTVTTEDFKYKSKLYSYFYSTYKAFTSIKNIDSYDSVIKFKPNLDSPITYKGNIEHYFGKAYLQSYPLLKNQTKENCIYGSIYYQTLDERIFTAYPEGIKKAFNIPFADFEKQMKVLNSKLISKYGENYEGSIFWKEWFEAKGLKLILDLDLKIPNSIKYE